MFKGENLPGGGCDGHIFDESTPVGSNKKTRLRRCPTERGEQSGDEKISHEREKTKIFLDTLVKSGCDDPGTFTKKVETPMSSTEEESQGQEDKSEGNQLLTSDEVAIVAAS